MDLQKIQCEERRIKCRNFSNLLTFLRHLELTVNLRCEIEEESVIHTTSS
jgi:hypothetical protein